MTISHRNRASSVAAARIAVPALLDSLAGFAPRALPITEREYLSRLLDFTAWDGESVEHLAALEHPILFGGTLADRNQRPLPIATEPHRSEVTLERALFLRDMFREHLAERVAGIRRWDFGKHHLYPNMLVLPARNAVPEGSGALALYLPRDLFTGIEYALELLFDEERSSGDFLRPCEFESCGGYFLRSDKGGKPAKYHNACRKRLRAKSRHIRRKTRESSL